jgi:hypothetical protein
MKIDIADLRRNYASLPDGELLQINPDDLTDLAHQCYTAEMEKRGLSAETAEAGEEAGGDDDGVEPIGFDAEAEPDWLEDAAEVYSVVVRRGSASAQDSEAAREALLKEGIPCHLDVVDRSEESESDSEPVAGHRIRVLVPGRLNLRAASVLDRDLFNADFEKEWRTHLESFSDEELREMRPQVVFCGLFDQVARVTRAYEEEVKRRKG